MELYSHIGTEYYCNTANNRGITVRYIRLVIIACVLFALIAPLEVIAQSSPYYADVKGTVYSQAFRANGAKVTLYTYDPVARVQLDAQASVYTDSTGTFDFTNVVFKPDKGQFQYIVRADKGSSSALALVYALPPTANDSAYVATINMDLSVPSMYSETTVTVWSTQGKTTTHTNLDPVPGVKLTLYSVDLSGSNRTQIGTTVTTDYNGQHVFSGLPYGMYVVRAENGGQYGEQSFAAYQQITSTSLSANLPIPSVSPTPKPGATTAPGENPSGGFLGIPGFEAVAALIALLGAALCLRRA